MKHLVFFMISIVFLSMCVVDAEESVLVHHSFKGKVKVANKTSYIQNGTANVRNLKTPVVSVDVSKKTSRIKRVFVKNVRINSSNAKINGNKSQSALVQFNMGKKKASLKNIKVNSFSSRISNKTNGKSSCAAAFCVKATSRKSIWSKNNVVHTYGVNKFESIIKK